MGFVYEEVGEENRELWESIGWKDWGEKKTVGYFKTNYWVIEKERHIYMQPIGGFIDMPNYHDLSYKERIIRMEVIDKGNGTIETGFNISWDICHINIPKSVWEERDKIIQAIKEAFMVYRAGHGEEDINSISTTISGKPKCVEVDYNGR
ncbi:MAG: hypothetical protein K2L82_06320 [Lachnospiraceae bacterium]|nr:hypothetical protein [Lachnospiraceae bacterium]